MRQVTSGPREVCHYSDDSDSTSWIKIGDTSWERELIGIDGGVVATYDQAGDIELLLTDLHDDTIVAVDIDAINAGISLAECRWHI